MLNIGPQELLLILVVALVVVGPQRLPELSRSIGKALRSLRSAQDEMRRTVNEVLEPQVVGEATKDLRRARDEVREALRPERPAAKTPVRNAATPSAAPTAGTPTPEQGAPGEASDQPSPEHRDTPTPEPTG